MPFIVYLGLWLLSSYGIVHPTAFTGATALIGTAAQLEVGAVGLLILWQLTAFFAGTLLIGVLSVGAQSTPLGVTLKVFGVGALAVISLLILIFGPTGRDNNPWVARGPEAWICREVGPKSVACIPRDIKFMAERYFTAMRRVDPKMRVLIDSEKTILYTEDEHAWGQSSDVLVYMDTDLAEPEQTWASYLMSFTVELPKASSFSEEECDGIQQAELIWLGIIRGNEIDDEEVKTLSAKVAGC